MTGNAARRADEKLYAKYGLTQKEIAFIESMIRAMEKLKEGIYDFAKN
jgi:hypothetical protein